MDHTPPVTPAVRGRGREGGGEGERREREGEGGGREVVKERGERGKGSEGGRW